MTQVTIHESPSQQVLAKAAETFEAKDSTGRVFTLKKPGFLAQFKIVELAGPETAKNEVFMNMIQPLIYITAIDGDPIFFPVNRLQLDGLISRVDEHGFLAVSQKLNEQYGDKDINEEKEAIKKIVTSAPLKECLWLVRGGVPFDVAFGIDDVMRAGMCIILSEMEGRVFDLNNFKFKDLE